MRFGLPPITRSAITTQSRECPLVGHPCRVPAFSQAREVGWASLAEKAAWLDGASSLDALRRGTQRIALRFAGYPTAEARTKAFHRWVRDGIRYVQDFRVTEMSRGEEFADAETIIARGYEDCDGKARLFVALVRAAEIVRPLRAEARIRPVYKKHPLEFIHVQAEVRWPGSMHHPGAMAGGWLLAELILADCEIGVDPDTMPRGPNGQRRLA